MNLEEIREVLKNHKALVTFIKKDGTERIMHCTLIPEFLPVLLGSSSEKSKEVLPVWDLEVGNWRSFRIDSVTKVEKL